MGPHQINEAEFLKLCTAAVRKCLRNFRVGSWELGDEDAETLAEDVFMKLWCIKSIDDPRRAVWKTARNTVISALRRSRRHPRLGLDATPEPRFEPPGHGSRRGEPSPIEVGEQLDALVEVFPPGERRIFMFCRNSAVELSDSTTIAQALGMKPQAVSQAKKRMVSRAAAFRPQFDQLEGR